MSEIVAKKYVVRLTAEERTRLEEVISNGKRPATMILKARILLKGDISDAGINGVAQRQLLPRVEHRQSRYLNNRAENSHRPTRRRERQMQRFKSRKQAQNFISSHAIIHGHFHPRRHLMTSNSYGAIRTEAFNIWQWETCAQQVA